MRQQRLLDKELAARRRASAARSGSNPKRSKGWKIWWEIPVLLGIIVLGLHLLGFWIYVKDFLPDIRKQGFWGLWQGRTRDPSNGVFPEGCKWREVTRHKGEHVWANMDYEFWNASTETWSSSMPVNCLLQGETVSSRTEWWGGTPRSQVACDANSCIYRNLWYNAGRWYILVGDGHPPIEWWMLTRNVDLHPLHVRNASEFATTVKSKLVKGSTLMFDFVFFMHPTAIGHWGEMLYPLYSILRNETDMKTPPDRLLMLNVKRGHLMQWVRENLAVTLKLPTNQSLPPIFLQREQEEVYAQSREPLQGIPDDEWVCIESALVVNNHIFSGGSQTFFNQQDAQAYRTAMYERFGIPLQRPEQESRRIIFQRKSSNRRIINEPEFIQILKEYGEVEVVEFTAATPFKTQLEVLSRADVFVSVHTSNLANAHLLLPGSAVVEIIQHNWAWADMDKSFQIQTAMMGDIHHFAIRAQGQDMVRYLDPRDTEKFASWGSQDCVGEECVEAHTRVDVVVDLEQLKALLDSRLPLVFGGASVASAALPWPEVERASMDQAAEQIDHQGANSQSDPAEQAERRQYSASGPDSGIDSDGVHQNIEFDSETAQNQESNDIGNTAQALDTQIDAEGPRGERPPPAVRWTADESVTDSRQRYCEDSADASESKVCENSGSPAGQEIDISRRANSEQEDSEVESEGKISEELPLAPHVREALRAGESTEEFEREQHLQPRRGRGSIHY